MNITGVYLKRLNLSLHMNSPQGSNAGAVSTIAIRFKLSSQPHPRRRGRLLFFVRCSHRAIHRAAAPLVPYNGFHSAAILGRSSLMCERMVLLQALQAQKMPPAMSLHAQTHLPDSLSSTQTSPPSTESKDRGPQTVFSRVETQAMGGSSCDSRIFNATSPVAVTTWQPPHSPAQAPPRGAGDRRAVGWMSDVVPASPAQRARYMDGSSWLGLVSPCGMPSTW